MNFTLVMKYRSITFSCFSSLITRVGYTPYFQWNTPRASFMASRSINSSIPIDSRPPALSKLQIQQILNRMIGQDVSIVEYKEFPSYEDRNYYLHLNTDMVSLNLGKRALKYYGLEKDRRLSNSRYVLKILNSKRSHLSGLALAKIQAMEHLFKIGFNCPAPIPLHNQDILLKLTLPSLQEKQDSIEYMAYILSYVEGEMVSTIVPSLDLLYQIGKIIGQLDTGLQVSIYLKIYCS